MPARLMSLVTASILLAGLGCAGSETGASPGAKAAANEPAAPANAPVEPAPLAVLVAQVGAAAPDFTLSDVNGVSHRLSDYTGKGRTVVLEWFNPDCPVTRSYHEPKNDMDALARAWADKGVTWLAINSGAPGKQGAGLDRNRRAVEEFGVSFPVLLDEDGSVGRAYEASTTPHMFVIDAQGVLRYAGAIDDGRPGAKGAVNLVSEALTAIAAGKPVTTTSTRAFGCSVKYAD